MDRSGEYLMYYRRQGFLAVSPSPARKLTLFLSLPAYRRSSYLTGEEVRGRELNDRMGRKPDPL
jgi:hypothetical protein